MSEFEVSVGPVRAAIVFGHTSELGRGLCRRLLARGHVVVGVARSRVSPEPDGLEQIQADLADIDDIARVVSRIKDMYPRFGILIYAAGALAAHDIGSINYADMELLYKVNTLAPIYIESMLYEQIDSNAADVVNITSSSVRDHAPSFAAYSTSKAALQRFGQDLQRHLQASSARIIEICPSGFTSDIYRNMRGVKVARDESIQIPAEDLAELIVQILDLPKIMELSHVFVNRKNRRP